MLLGNAFSVNSSIIHGKGRGRDNSIGKERSSIIGGAIIVLKIMVEEVKTQVPVSQAVKELTSRRFDEIIVKSMDIMHMSVGRDNIIRTSKVKISETMKIFLPTLCLWRMLKQCL